MNGLEALKEIKCDMEYVTRLDFVEPIVRGEVRDNLSKIYHRELPQLDQIEKELKAFEIIKSHAKEIKHFKYLLYMAKYWGENKVEVTKELLYNYDFPYTIDEFDLLKEVLK